MFGDSYAMTLSMSELIKQFTVILKNPETDKIDIVASTAWHDIVSAEIDRRWAKIEKNSHEPVDIKEKVLEVLKEQEDERIRNYDMEQYRKDQQT